MIDSTKRASCWVTGGLLLRWMTGKALTGAFAAWKEHP